MHAKQTRAEVAITVCSAGARVGSSSAQHSAAQMHGAADARLNFSADTTQGADANLRAPVG